MVNAQSGWMNGFAPARFLLTWTKKIGSDSAVSVATVCKQTARTVCGRIRREKTADNTQPPEKLYPPISFSEAHLEHIQSISEALKR
jgi:hypothetical protein